MRTRTLKVAFRNFLRDSKESVLNVMICSRFVSETKLKAEQGLLVFNFGKDLLCTMLGMLIIY